MAMQFCRTSDGEGKPGRRWGAYRGWGSFHSGAGWFVLIAMARVAVAAQSDPETAPAAASFSFDTLRERARTLAAKEYREEKNPELPDFLKKLNYDDYQAIHFRPDQALWQNELLQFKIHFFHRGNLFQDPVRIHVIEGAQVRDVNFSTNQFDYGTNKFPKPIPG